MEELEKEPIPEGYVVKWEEPPLWRMRMQAEWLFEQIHICIEEIREKRKKEQK